MTKPRVLVVYKYGGPMVFGDRIRIENILKLLRTDHFKVIEAPLPSITRWSLWKSLPTMFPLRSAVIPIDSRRTFLTWLDFNASINSLKRIMRRTNPDIVLAETSTVGWIATHVCEELSIPCVVDCHGLAFTETKGAGYDDWQQIKRMEEETFTKCDYLSVVSKRMKNYIEREFRISGKKIVITPNGSQPQDFTAQYKSPLKVIYAGVFAYWEKVHDFLDLAKQANQKVRFYMAGAGPLKKQLLKTIGKEKIPVKYLGYILRQKIFATLSKMQVGIAPSTKDLARVVASPIKVFDYMASGLPVITPRIGDWGDLINDEDCGIALDDDSIEKYLEALNILAGKDAWTKKSFNAIKVIEEKYSWDKVLQPLVNLLSNIAK